MEIRAVNVSVGFLSIQNQGKHFIASLFSLFPIKIKVESPRLASLHAVEDVSVISRLYRFCSVDSKLSSSVLVSGVRPLVGKMTFTVVTSSKTFSTYVFLPQFKKPVVGPEVLNGLTGVVVEKLDPQGRVDVNGEIWTAVSSQGGCVEEGEKVLVEKIDGNKLVVRKEKTRM